MLIKQRLSPSHAYTHTGLKKQSAKLFRKASTFSNRQGLRTFSNPSTAPAPNTRVLWIDTKKCHTSKLSPNTHTPTHQLTNSLTHTCPMFSRVFQEKWMPCIIIFIINKWSSRYPLRRSVFHLFSVNRLPHDPLRAVQSDLALASCLAKASDAAVL